MKKRKEKEYIKIANGLCRLNKMVSGELAFVPYKHRGDIIQHLVMINSNNES